MNIIFRHTLRSIFKNPLQSFMLLVSAIVITACLLTAFSIKSMFLQTAEQWAGAVFCGADVLITTTADEEQIDGFAEEHSEYIEEYIGMFEYHASAFTDDSSINAVFYFVKDYEKMKDMPLVEIMKTCDNDTGLPSATVSRDFADRMELKIGNVFHIEPEKGTRWVFENGGIDVQITAIADNKGLYYNANKVSVTLDYDEIPGLAEPLNRIYFYCADSSKFEGDFYVKGFIASEIERTFSQKVVISVDEGATEAMIEDSVSGSMDILTIAVAVVAVLMAVLLYFSYSVIARNRSDEMVKFKAAGATPFQSWLIMLAEAAVYALVGSLVGLGFGTLMIKIIETLVSENACMISIVVPAAKYFATAALTFFITLAACAVPAARVSAKSVHNLMSGSAKHARRYPWWLALISFAAFVGVFVSLFVVDEELLLPMMIVFIVTTVFAAVVCVPWILKGICNLTAIVAGRKEPVIAAYSMPRNGSVATVSSMAVLLSSMIFLTVSLLGVVNITSLHSDRRYEGDYVVTTIKSDKESYDEMLDTYVATDGVDEGCWYLSLSLSNFGQNGELMGEFVSCNMLNDGSALRFVSDSYTPELAARFDAAEHPLVVSYYLMRKYDLSIGDKLQLYFIKPYDNAPVDCEFEIVGIDYTFTAWDYIMYIRADEYYTTAGNKVEATANFLLRGDENAYTQLAETTNTDTETLFRSDNYFSPDKGGDAYGIILNVFVYLILGVAVIGLVNLISITASERKKEMEVYRLAGMTGGGVMKMAAVEGCILSLTGFAGGLLVCLGANQTVPAMARLVSRYLPRTPFDMQILWICLVCAALTFFFWMLASSVNLIRAGKTAEFRRSNGLMTE